MAQKPSIPKGTRDFTPEQTARRNYIFDTIKDVFRSFGYSQIETPAMENLSTLLGKYGEEGDKLLFRIQNSGEKAAEAPEKGLRYDLTVPFARFVVQHQGELSFPFKRFQIQPVWRADRPQKGRYREFYQCDVDAIGSRSQLLELELVQMVKEVFRRLDVRVVLKINNRKVLAGLAEACGFPERIVDITVAIDKLDKIGLEAVREELLGKGLTAEALAVLEPVLKLEGSFAEKLAAMRCVLASSAVGLQGLDELEELFGYIASAGVSLPVEMDLSLARGLNYYTGAIFEVKALDWQIGSISGGGRYDNLTGIFGLHGRGRSRLRAAHRWGAAWSRGCRGGLSGERQTEKTVRIRRPQGHPVHQHLRLIRGRSRSGEHQESGERRTEILCSRRPQGHPGVPGIKNFGFLKLFSTFAVPNTAG